LFKEQIEEWKKTCLSANAQEENRTKALSFELKEEKKQSENQTCHSYAQQKILVKQVG
jgi:hypothetical protein